MTKKKDKQEKDKGHKTGGIMAAYKKVLKHIASFSSITEEVRVHCVKGTGISIKAVDPAHVAMRELTVKVGPKLLVINDKEIGIDLDKLKKLIPLMPNEEIAVGFVDYGNRITYSYGHHRPEHKVADLLGMSDPKIPTLTLPGCYRANIMNLISSVKHIETMSRLIKFEVCNGGFNVKGSNGGDEYTGKFPGTCMDFDPDAGEGTLTSVFSIDYIMTVLRTYKSMGFEDVWIQLGDDYPGIFEVEVNDGDYQFYDRFILAPRIENA